MSDEDKRLKARRNLLLTIGGGFFVVKALPEKWIKPVVDEIVLPAHATSSDCEIVDDTPDSSDDFDDCEDAAPG